VQLERQGAVIRAEDASVSHQQLAASGNAGSLANGGQANDGQAPGAQANGAQANGAQANGAQANSARPNGAPPDLAGLIGKIPAWTGDRAVRPLPPRPESAALARDFTRAALRHWGMSDRGDVAILIVSELVTNALRHAVLSTQWMPGEHPITLSLLRGDHDLLCVVMDPASSVPVRKTPDAAAEGGRGLQVVESCSASWGWQPADGGGKVVWALLR
jgi:anti-sigma regulatory factor (Ser/Thr protein kinase)